MLKIFQIRLQQYKNQERLDVHVGFWKGRRTRDQIANFPWIIAREFQKNVYFCFIDCVKTFDYVDHNKLWKIHKAMVNTRPPYLSPEKHVWMSKSNSENLRTMYWFKTEKRAEQGYMLSPCLLNLYAEHIMQNAGLDESQPGIKIARKNISNLRQMIPLKWQRVKMNYIASCWGWKEREKKLA